MRSPRLALITLKRLSADSPLVRAGVIAITLVPLLYGALYLWAFWDPYGKLDKMPVALVNEDAAAKVGTETLSAGSDLVDELLRRRTLEWHVVSAQDASAGLADRRYYLELTIPRGFSTDLASANTTRPVRARLRVTARESSNMLASQIASRVFGEIRAAAGESASKRYLENIYVGFADARGGLTDAAAGADSLADGLADARDGARRLADGTTSARSGASRLARGLKALDAGAGSADAGAASLASGTTSLAGGLARADSGARSVAAGSGRLASGASAADAGARAVATGSSSLAAGLAAADAGAAQEAAGTRRLEGGAGQLASAMSQVDAGGQRLAGSAGGLASGAQRLAAGVDRALSQVGDAADGANRVSEGADSLDSALRAYLGAHPEAADNPAFAAALEASAKVKAGSGDLADALAIAEKSDPALASGAMDVASGAELLHAAAQQLARGIASADTGARDLASGAGDLAGGAASLSAGVGSATLGAKSLATGSATLVSGTGSLAAGAAGLATGSRTLAGGVGSASTGAGVLAAGSARLASGTHALAAGTRAARTGATALARGVSLLGGGARDLADGLSPAASGSRELASGLTAGARGVPAFSAKAQAANAAMMSDPVALDTVRSGQVPTYGTGFAPYFIPLALWIGALLVFFLIKPLPPRAVAASAPAPVIAFAGFLPAALIGTVQATVLLAVVQLMLGLNPVNPIAYYGVGVLTAVAFVAILQMLNASMGVVGKLVSIIVLMLQLTSAGGTFPIQMVPVFFQRLSPFLPMTYAVAGLRQAISGGDLPALGGSALVLLGFSAVSMLVTIATARRAQTYTMERLHPSLEL